jgi:hypothetical protein
MNEDKEFSELINTYLVSKNPEEAFKAKLYPMVLNLLMNNTSLLYQVLYRIDVKEEKVKSVFVDNPLVELAAERITMLIIERQKEKIQWRNKYSEGEKLRNREGKKCEKIYTSSIYLFLL